MDEIFDHSRQRFMEALQEVEKDIDNIAAVKEAWEKAMMGKSTREMDAGMILYALCSALPDTADAADQSPSSSLRSSLSGLSTRVANLESERRHLRITVDALRDELITLTANIDTFEVRKLVLRCMPSRAKSPADPHSSLCLRTARRTSSTRCSRSSATRHACRRSPPPARQPCQRRAV
jgi:hypothetical protein